MTNDTHLPKELQAWLSAGTVRMPPQIVQYISAGWAAIAPRDRDRVLLRCQGQRDLPERVITVVDEITRSLYSSLPQK